MLDPVGFWSYARQDDAHSDGHLSQLRAIVGKAVVLQCGDDVKLWQDITAISYGADWASTIERTIGQTTFFIPIVTPRFLKSQYCHDEFTLFRRRMQAMGYDDLIFPVHYIGVDDIRPQETVFSDDLAALRRSQWIDFRPLFYSDLKSSEVRRWAGDLAGSILKALRKPGMVLRAAPAAVDFGQTPASPSPTKSGASVTIGMVLEPPNLDPTTAASASIGEVTHYNIFEGLTKINEDFSVAPLLAEIWTFSRDLKTLTFTLKPNVKFQDGEPFSSKDVKFSFERFAAKDSTNMDKGFFASIQSIDTPDPHTVMLNFEYPYFQALFHLGMRSAIIVNEKSATANATNPIGTGPYKLVNWTKGSSITLDKWDGFRDPAKIAIARATFRFISNSPAAVAAMLSGVVEAFPRFANVQALGQFKSDPRFRVLVGGTEGKTILAMNNKKKPLDDLKVRQAIAYAIDRKAIIDGAMNGLGTPIGSHLTPNDPGYVDLTGMYPHDPAKAKALLKEAGITTPLALSIILPPPQYARQGGEIIAAELAEVGINAEIQEVEWAQWLSGVYKDKNYDLTIISHVEPLEIGIYANPNYYFQYDSPAFQAIYAKVVSAPNLEAFKAALGDAQKKLAEDCVSAFLFQQPNATVADAKLEGLWKNAPIIVNDLSAISWKRSEESNVDG